MAFRHFARLIPFLTIVVIAFALLQLYSAVMFAGSGQYPFAALYAVFGFAGFALARALWMHRRKLGEQKP